jgi:subtilisin family serine protease
MKSYRSSVAGLALAARAVVLAVLLAAPPAQAQPNQLRLLSRSFTPTPGIEPAVRSALGSAARPTVHAIVQFRAPLTVAQHRLLRENGVLLQGHLGGNAYSAAIPRGLDLDRPQVRSLLRWVGQIRPADKLKRPVAARAFETWAIDAPTGRVKLLVQFHPDVTAAQVAEDLRTVAATGERYGADNSWATTVDPGDIDRLAALDTVRSIQQGPTPFLPLNDGGRRIAESDEAQQVRFGAPQPANGKVSGAGVHVGICDSGVDEHHDDFDDVTAAGTAGASRVYHAVAGAGGHGTHVASIAAGSGLNSAANGYPAFSLRGHAPRASVGDYGGFGGNVQSFHDAIVTDHTEVTNHSYVQSMTVYDATAASIDLIVRGDAVDAAGDPVPARPQVWAAGNNGTAAQYGNEEGYYAVFTSAKNSISVGSVDVIDGRLSDFSSLGPTFDGRIKPDLMAPGCFDSIAAPSVGIQAARANSQGYTGMCGTSMAAPVVTGIVADLMEQMQAACRARCWWQPRRTR